MHLAFKFTLYMVIICITIWLASYHRLRYKVEYVYKVPNAIRHYSVWPDVGSKFSNLEDLTTIPFPDNDRPTITSLQQVEKLAPFDVKMSLDQYLTLEKLISKFEQVMISLKLQDQWFIGARSLVGSIRHHDIIPWDDGVDIYVHIYHRQKIQSALKELAPDFKVGTQINSDLLYFRPISEISQVDSNTFGSLKFSKNPWPLIYIHYFEKVDLNMANEFGDGLKRLNLSDIFPLTYRPFGKHWYPAPRRPIHFLKNYYSDEKPLCSSQSYSRTLGKKTMPTFMDCRKLLKRYSFVQRCPIPEKERVNSSAFFCDEHLVDVNGQTLHKIRTVLDPDEVNSHLYEVKHEEFKCP